MEQIEEKEIRPYDVIVIGAGAAGMMAAGTAARDGKRVLLIEKMDKSGRKVRITGKGRCNVTNARPAEEFAAQVRTNAEFLGQAFAEFNNRAAIRFFEKAGVKLDIERGERVFPKSGKAWDIANALLEYCYENGVKIIYNTRVTEIMTLGDKVFGVRYINRRGFERKEECPQVIVATGGVSYPATGSTGDGYTFAADLGHTVEPVRPSLTPLVSSHPQIGYLDGLLLKNIRAVLYVDDEPVREEFGEIGFSDRGIEGAVALRMSRDAVDALIDGKRVKLTLDLKPALTEEVLRDRIGWDAVAAKVQNPLKGKKIGAYYGCLLLRPSREMQFDDPENPTILEDFIRAIGAEPVYYGMRNECCGGYISLKEKEMSGRMSCNIVDLSLIHI